MDPELKRRVDALRRPLELAAADGFAGVRKVAGLGHALRAACDGLIARMESEQLAQWRATLAGWEKLDEHQQAIEVARGMRLLARFPRSAAPVSRTAAPGLRAESVPRPPPPPGEPIAVAPTPAPAPAPAPARRATKPALEREIDPLAEPTHTLPGIGPAFAERLAEKGLVTVEDLLWMVPRRYDDVRDARTLAEVCRLEEGERVTFVAKVASARMVFARGRRWAEVRLLALDPASQATALVRWFNVFAGIDKRMPAGCIVALSGVVKRRGGRCEFANPDILGIEIEGVIGKAKPAIIARYPDVAGVPAARLRSACAAACARVGDQVDDGVPGERRAGRGDAEPRRDAPPPALAAGGPPARRARRDEPGHELLAAPARVRRAVRARRRDHAAPARAPAGCGGALPAGGDPRRGDRARAAVQR